MHIYRLWNLTIQVGRGQSARQEKRKQRKEDSVQSHQFQDFVYPSHIIISEDVTYKGTTITLQNKIEVTQDVVGMVVRPGDWDESGEDLGGDAE